MAFKIGDKIEEQFSYTQKDVELFMDLTGDYNPVHHDYDYASKTIFQKPIIHGFLAASIFSKVLGIKMPGYGTIYMKQDMSFKRPMYVDNVYTCIIEITDRQESKFKLDTKIVDELGQVMIEGGAYIMNKDVE